MLWDWLPCRPPPLLLARLAALLLGRLLLPRLLLLPRGLLVRVDPYEPQLQLAAACCLGQLHLPVTVDPLTILLCRGAAPQPAPLGGLALADGVEVSVEVGGQQPLAARLVHLIQLHHGQHSKGVAGLWVGGRGGGGGGKAHNKDRVKDDAWL